MKQYQSLKQTFQNTLISGVGVKGKVNGTSIAFNEKEGDPAPQIQGIVYILRSKEYLKNTYDTYIHTNTQTFIQADIVTYRQTDHTNKY